MTTTTARQFVSIDVYADERLSGSLEIDAASDTAHQTIRNLVNEGLSLAPLSEAARDLIDEALAPVEVKLVAGLGFVALTEDAAAKLIEAGTPVYMERSVAGWTVQTGDFVMRDGEVVKIERVESKCTPWHGHAGRAAHVSRATVIYFHADQPFKVLRPVSVTAADFHPAGDTDEHRAARAADGIPF